MTENPSENPEYTTWRLYRRLFSYVTPYKLAIWGSLVGYIIFAATSPATSAWLGWTVDAINRQDYAELRVISPILCVLIVLVRGIGGFLGSYSLAYIANNVMHKLRCELMEHLIVLPARYYDQTTTGRLVSKLTYDVQQIMGAASNALVVMVREGFTVLGLLGYLLYIDWRLTMTFLVVTPFVGLVVNAASKRFRRYSTQMQASMGDVTQITTESIKGHRVIRTFNASDFVTRNLSRASDRNRRQNMKMAMTENVATPVTQLIVAMALAILVWLAMSPEFFADKTSGQFVAFLGAAGLLAKPMRQLSQVNAVIQRGMSAAFSIFTLLDEAAEVDTGTREINRTVGKIEFKDVSFAYNEGTPALQNISFIAEPGKSIALVGKSGSGKSSLVSLIPRFYEYGSGSILIDGIPLNELTLHNLRQQISLVTQQVVLFNGTVAENIAYGDNTVSREKIIAAATSAHAMEFIEQLPQGIDTEVGDDARLLSGGQRQRIAIARALLKDAPILILDEATSSLDSESEHHIQVALKTLMKGRTTFVIAHRLSTIENADLILVLHEGSIVESGTHAELIAKGAQYSRLHKIQFTESDTAAVE